MDTGYEIESLFSNTLGLVMNTEILFWTKDQQLYYMYIGASLFLDHPWETMVIHMAVNNPKINVHRYTKLTLGIRGFIIKVVWNKGLYGTYKRSLPLYLLDWFVLYLFLWRHITYDSRPLVLYLDSVVYLQHPGRSPLPAAPGVSGTAAGRPLQAGGS